MLIAFGLVATLVGSYSFVKYLQNLDGSGIRIELGPETFDLVVAPPPQRSGRLDRAALLFLTITNAARRYSGRLCGEA